MITLGFIVGQLAGGRGIDIDAAGCEIDPANRGCRTIDED